MMMLRTKVVSNGDCLFQEVNAKYQSTEIGSVGSILVCARVAPGERIGHSRLGGFECFWIPNPSSYSTFMIGNRETPSRDG